ncbi:MAG: hypothetical protein ABL964_15650 [Steroidobacteraceae bacterium]
MILPASKVVSKVASKAGNRADPLGVKAVPAPQAASHRRPETAPVRRLAGQAVPAAQQQDLSRASPAVKVAKAARVVKVVRVDRLAPRRRAVLLLQVAAEQAMRAAVRVRRVRQEQVAEPATPVAQLAALAQEPAARAAAR